MTNINGHCIAAEPFDLAAHEVEPGYFKIQMERFEQLYHCEFPGGWGEFFNAYSAGTTDQGNLDFEEWAFLCEHFRRELSNSRGGK